MKKREPNTLPCDRPGVTSHELDAAPSMLTFCVLPVRNDLMHRGGCHQYPLVTVFNQKLQVDLVESVAEIVVDRFSTENP